MEQIFLQPRAKINVALDITGKRADGFHELDTVMVSVGIYDGLLIKKSRTKAVSLTTDDPLTPPDGRNLVYKAALYMIERFGAGGVDIELNKNIPISAGLGGGSADCAAALTGVRDLYGLPVTDDELQKLSVRFGADVPFCVKGGTARARGVGEILTPLPPHPRVCVLIARPPVYVSTAEVFGAYDAYDACDTCETRNSRPDVEAVEDGIIKNDLRLVASGVGNVLEPVTAKKYPLITRVKDVMKYYGALAASMTGSGPCVFGYFINETVARAAAEELRENFGIKYFFITNI